MDTMTPDMQTTFDTAYVQHRVGRIVTTALLEGQADLEVLRDLVTLACKDPRRARAILDRARDDDLALRDLVALLRRPQLTVVR